MVIGIGCFYSETQTWVWRIISDHYKRKEDSANDLKLYIKLSNVLNDDDDDEMIC